MELGKWACLLGLLSACQASWRIPSRSTELPPMSAGHRVEERRDAQTRETILRRVWFHDGEGLRVKDGLEEIFYPDGSPRSRRSYALGVPAGLWQTFWPNGGLRSDQEHPADGSPSELRFFYPSGQLQAHGLSKSDGERVGPWRFRREDGSLEKQGSYLGGLQDGEWSFFDEQGKRTAQGNYAAGIRVGTWDLAR